MKRKHWQPMVYMVLSVPVTILAIGIVSYFSIPNPMMILIIPVVTLTYLEGYVSGGLSGLVAIAYSFHFFFIRTADQAATQKLLTIFFAVSSIVILVGRLKSRDKDRIAQLIKTKDELRKEKEKAEELSHAKSTFLSGMSHEIRTPINAIIGMTKIAKDSHDPERIKHCLEIVDDSSIHLLGIVNDVLDISKIEAGKFELSESDFLLEGMLNRIVNINQFRLDQKSQNFAIDIKTGVPAAIIADQQRLAQVITNLLSNSIKFTPEKGQIALSINMHSESPEMVTLRFEMADNGIGMTQEQQLRLFQAFEQTDTSITRRFGGTGLGLSISKSIVEMMGGSIWAQSTPGEGSSFIFTITALKGQTSRSTYLSPNVDWEKVRILVVNDAEHDVLNVKHLATSFGIACDVALSAEEALQCMRNQKYHITFISAQAAAGENLAFVRSVHKEFGEQTLVMVSAGDMAAIEREAQGLGVNHFLGRPVLPSPFIDCVNKCFGESGEQVEQLEHAEVLSKDIFLGQHLLLVDDIDINREIIRAMLENTGISIIEAENGQVACELFSQNHDEYDVILMDVQMPVMDGCAAAKNIREMSHISKAAAIPILAMTANVFREDIEECLESGMDDHIGKPVDAVEMIEKIKRHVPVRQLQCTYTRGR